MEADSIHAAMTGGKGGLNRGVGMLLDLRNQLGPRPYIDTGYYEKAMAGK